MPHFPEPVAAERALQDGLSFKVFVRKGTAGGPKAAQRAQNPLPLLGFAALQDGQREGKSLTGRFVRRASHRPPPSASTGRFHQRQGEQPRADGPIAAQGLGRALAARRILILEQSAGLAPPPGARGRSSRAFRAALSQRVVVVVTAAGSPPHKRSGRHPNVGERPAKRSVLRDLSP